MIAGRRLQSHLRRILAARIRRRFPAVTVGPADDHAIQPDVTVIVPAFNHESFVEPALRSVLSQTYQGFQIIVVDDGSRDRTAATAAAVADPRISLHTNAGNLGLATTVLHALSHVSTPYVAILNSDDLYHPERLSRCRTVLETNTDVQVVATGVTPIDENGLCLSPSGASRFIDGGAVVLWMRWFSGARHLWDASDFRLALLETNFLVTSSNIFCRTQFLRSRTHALDGLRYCLDWQVFVEAAAADGLVVLADELLGYRLHGTNTIWMRDPRHRAEFVLEVNRVLATALKHLSRSLETMPATERVAVIRTAIDHVRRQPDADPYAILLADLAGGNAVSDALEESRARLQPLTRSASR